MNMNDHFRYLDVGLPDPIQRKKLFGDFAGAIRLIDLELEKANLPEPMRSCLLAQREIITRLPKDYPLSKAEALALAQKEIPDFTEAEFDTMQEQGRIDWIYIDGEPHYHGLYFETLSRVDAEVKARLPKKPAAADGQDNGIGRLDRAVQIMQEQGKMSARIRCRTSIRMHDEVFRKGERVRAYLPIPCACPSQSEIQVESVTPAPTHISPEDAKQRVVFWEEVMEENHPFEVTFSYVQTAKHTDLSNPLPSTEQPDFCLEEEHPHIVFTPYIKALAASLTEGVTEPLEKARRIYDFITKNAKYSYMRAYFGLESIADMCARNLRGDCGVFAILFITLCRCAGIPAVWESGWAVSPGDCGCHDWARFYVAPYGWLYVDPSFGVGSVRDGKETRRMHYFGNLDPYRMVANSAFQADFDVPKEHWRADPYDNQQGEFEFADRGLCFDEFVQEKEVLEFTEL